MTINLYLVASWAFAAVVLVAAGYLLATFRRSRRAATIGLAGVGLFGLAVFGWLTEVTHERALEAVGFTSGRTLREASPWVQPAHLAVAHGLLLWAVVTDRPPPADE